MHESTIDRNALLQLSNGVIPWSITIQAGLDPLPFYTSPHIGRALHGYTIRPSGTWKPAKVQSPDTYPHLVYGVGCLPALDNDFAANLDLLIQEITRSPENGLQSVGYNERTVAWYRGLTAFPHLYPTALKRIYQP
jgi:hypothetical protein